MLFSKLQTLKFETSTVVTGPGCDNSARNNNAQLKPAKLHVSQPRFLAEQQT
jgi:hypothetical protein